jgi:hypothetical protein
LTNSSSSIFPKVRYMHTNHFGRIWV